jgi:hypothetical protein
MITGLLYILLLFVLVAGTFAHGPFRDLLLGALGGLAFFLAVVWFRCWAEARRALR